MPLDCHPEYSLDQVLGPVQIRYSFKTHQDPSVLPAAISSSEDRSCVVFQVVKETVKLHTDHVGAGPKAASERRSNDLIHKASWEFLLNLLKISGLKEKSACLLV